MTPTPTTLTDDLSAEEAKQFEENTAGLPDRSESEYRRDVHEIRHRREDIPERIEIVCNNDIPYDTYPEPSSY